MRDDLRGGGRGEKGREGEWDEMVRVERVIDEFDQVKIQLSE